MHSEMLLNLKNDINDSSNYKTINDIMQNSFEYFLSANKFNNYSTVSLS